MPKIVIPSDQLGKVPLSTLSISDEQSVSARLESLESRVTKMCDIVTKGQIPQVQLVMLQL